MGRIIIRPCSACAGRVGIDLRGRRKKRCPECGGAGRLAYHWPDFTPARTMNRRLRKERSLKGRRWSSGGDGVL